MPAAAANPPPDEPTFSEGFAKSAPILPGMIPFAMIAGVSAAEAGLDVAAGIAQSVVIFAGAAQIAMTQLIGQGALPAVIILTGLIINLRFLMYSASMAPLIHDLSAPRRWAIAYLLTDQAYAVYITRLGNSRPQPSASARLRYFMGAGAPVAVVWHVGAIAGYFLGGGVPESWQLGFAIPLGFMALMVPAVQDRPSVAAALVAAATAVVAGPLPYNLGLFLAAVLGITSGVMVEARQRRRQEDVST